MEIPGCLIRLGISFGRVVVDKISSYEKKNIMDHRGGYSRSYRRQFKRSFRLKVPYA
jgi:hypothetical protein